MRVFVACETNSTSLSRGNLVDGSPRAASGGAVELELAPTLRLPLELGLEPGPKLEIKLELEL